MAEIIGKKWICERCKKEVFLKCIDEKSLDGGFTKEYKFEKLPDGWGREIVGFKSTEFCPECRKEFKRLCGSFLMEGGIKNDEEEVY